MQAIAERWQLQAQTACKGQWWLLSCWVQGVGERGTTMTLSFFAVTQVLDLPVWLGHPPYTDKPSQTWQIQCLCNSKAAQGHGCPPFDKPLHPAHLAPPSVLTSRPDHPLKHAVWEP